MTYIPSAEIYICGRKTKMCMNSVRIAANLCTSRRYVALCARFSPLTRFIFAIAKQRKVPEIYVAHKIRKTFPSSLPAIKLYSLTLVLALVLSFAISHSFIFLLFFFYSGSHKIQRLSTTVYC